MSDPQDTGGAALGVPIVTVHGEAVAKYRAAAVVRGIDELKQEAEHFKKSAQQKLEETATKYAAAPSPVLAGIVGGALGMAGGLFLPVASAALVVTGPLGLALGAALGVLVFRGRHFRRLERSTLKARGATDLILSQIAKLPIDAPPEVRAKLYAEYAQISIRYAEIAQQAMDDEGKH